MSSILISAAPGELRAALVDEGLLVDVLFDRPGSRPLPGDIYLARVTRLLPGLAAAFVDLGDGVSAYLPTSVEPPHEGQALMVQIARPALSGKSARATTEIAIAGRSLIFTPTRPGISLSRRLVDEDERARLMGLLAGMADAEEGFVLRTVARGAAEAVLAAEVERLREIWREASDQVGNVRVPSLLHAELDAGGRALRDWVDDEVEAIYLDDREGHRAAEEFCRAVMPEFVSRLHFHGEAEPLFEAWDIEAQIDAALEPRVMLASGAAITIDPTEALTLIDVDSGAGGRQRRQQTVLDVNLEAAGEIARQLRLRNIAGFIAVDFIRMKDPAQQRQVVAALAAHSRDDPLSVRVADMAPMGLVELTRKRARSSLADTLSTNCPACGAAARIKSPLTRALEALRAVGRAARASPGRPLTLCAAPEIVACLEGAAAEALAEAEAGLGGALSVAAEPTGAAGGFEIVVG